jgi:hypothetical protein
MPAAGSPALSPSERGKRITVSAINKRLTEYRRALSLGGGLDFTCCAVPTSPQAHRVLPVGRRQMPGTPLRDNREAYHFYDYVRKR